MSNRTRANEEGQLAFFTLTPDQQDVIAPDFDGPMTVIDTREGALDEAEVKRAQEEQLTDKLAALIAIDQTARNDRMPGDMR